MRYWVIDQQYRGARLGQVIDADPTAPRTVAALRQGRLKAIDDELVAMTEPSPVSVATPAPADPVTTAPAKPARSGQKRVP